MMVQAPRETQAKQNKRGEVQIIATRKTNRNSGAIMIPRPETTKGYPHINPARISCNNRKGTHRQGDENHDSLIKMIRKRKIDPCLHRQHARGIKEHREERAAILLSKASAHYIRPSQPPLHTCTYRHATKSC